MAIAPKGYTNLDVKIGGLSLYYHKATGQVALMLTSPDNKSQVGEGSMKHFPVKADAEAWVKATFEDAPVQQGVVAYSHTTKSYEQVEVRWNVSEGLWYVMRNGRYAGNKLRADGVFAPVPSWIEQMNATKEKIERLEAEVREAQEEWGALLKEGTRLSHEKTHIEGGI